MPCQMPITWRILSSKYSRSSLAVGLCRRDIGIVPVGWDGCNGGSFGYGCLHDALIHRIARDKAMNLTRHKERCKMNDQLLRVNEAAVVLNVSRWTVYRWVEEGKLSGTKIVSRPYA